MADKNVQIKNKAGDRLFPASKASNIIYNHDGGNLNDVIRNMQVNPWKDLALINGFQGYSSSDKPRYKRLNNVVYLSGTVNNGDNNNPFILPVEARPDRVIRTNYLTSSGSGYVSITEAGVVTLNNYKEGKFSFASIDGISFAL